jgi:hypothetical protein
MLPADEHLHADDLEGVHVNLRLIVDEQFLFFQRLAQVVLELEALHGLGVHAEV